mmetsp:Transcript_39541/g.95068  ORF Transcript_39541/g.95068 Transcript_39541/m.95068 type:complete len:231 (-) Transcript_39541:335-1027(-)
MLSDAVPHARTCDAVPLIHASKSRSRMRASTTRPRQASNARYRCRADEYRNRASSASTGFGSSSVRCAFARPYSSSVSYTSARIDDSVPERRALSTDAAPASIPRASLTRSWSFICALVKNWSRAPDALPEMVLRPDRMNLSSSNRTESAPPSAAPPYFTRRLSNPLNFASSGRSAVLHDASAEPRPPPASRRRANIDRYDALSSCSSCRLRGIIVVTNSLALAGARAVV